MKIVKKYCFLTINKQGEGGLNMANCGEMKKGYIYKCDTCGLELQVTKTCSCGSGGEDACSVPLQCCGKDMKKKS